MNLKNIISIFVLLVVVLMVLPSAYGYTFGRGTMHDTETSDFVLHPEKDNTMNLEDLQKVAGTHDDSYISNNVLSDYDYMLYPDTEPICTFTFDGIGSLYGYPHTGLQEIGPNLYGIGPHLDNIGPHIDTTPYGGWGEPTEVGTYGLFRPGLYGNFYGLDVI